ncbi:PH domain-containing protein DDB_G0287875-like [Eriocheir sinensis]|uniref:PH domain-containing protein DDB_G0287875-like n=1 Tax=Eriocheir sinensis TaxID=95602 RepID=UPI0021C62FA9|nr:PH domain-containing protein DDB_G0287875-like [Eriocheir sinensis]
MVAPVTPGKSSRYLVRIPRTSPLQPTPTRTVTRHRVLRAGGKLGPAAAAAAASQSTKVPQLQAPHTPEPPPTTLTTTTTTTTTTPGIPFRSLAGSVQGEGRQRCSSGMKRKAYELEPQDDPLMERCRQNAINARRNRELKKAQMAELERRAEEADQERCRLAEENRRLKEDNTRLQREVGHLSGVLRNQSRLSDILEKLAPPGGSRSSRQVGGVHP